MSIQITPFGKYHGKDAKLFTLTNKNGFSVSITDAGGALVSAVLDGHDMLLGYDSAEGYEQNGGYIGMLIGRHGNRIGGAKFTLNGKEYALVENDNGNQLHGGSVGFNSYIWEVKALDEGEEPQLQLTHSSPDGDQGFPGNIKVTVIYKVNVKNGVEIHYSAVSDADTVCNLTNHSYFNLACGGDILGHELMIKASKFCPCDEHALANGEIKEVKGSPFDFTTAKPIGRDIEADCEQIRFGGGFDHNYCIDPHATDQPIAVAKDPASGRTLEVFTDQPGVQFYAGNFLSTNAGKGGKKYGKRQGFCLETQKYPNGTSFTHFPSPFIKAGEEYSHYCEYRFSL